MLKKSVLARIIVALEYSSFTAADFDVTTGGKSAEPLLKVTFRYDTSYTFLVRSGTNGYYTTESPGEYQSVEHVNLVSLAMISSRIETWLRNVKDDLQTSIPVYRELDELRQKIDEHVKEHVSNPDERFTRTEIEDLGSKLDELSRKFSELSERNQINEQELGRLNEELARVKENLATYTRGTWYKTAATKLWSVIEKIMSSKESRQVIAEAARKAIGIDGPA